MNKTFIYNPDEFRRGMAKAIRLGGSVGTADLVIFPLVFIGSFFVPYRIVQWLVRLVALLGIIGVVYQLYFLPKKVFKNEAFRRDEYDVTFDEKGLKLMNMKAESKYLYEDFDRILTDDEFIFFEKGDSFIFIPLRIFNAEEKNRLKDLEKNDKDDKDKS